VPGGEIVGVIDVRPRPPPFARACAHDSGQIFRVAGRQTEVDQTVQERSDGPMKCPELNWIGQLPVTDALDCRPDLFRLQGQGP
jgi:hypothetical protein